MAAQDARRASWVEIDAGAVRHNLRLIRRLAGAARVYAVCKGDAYGFDAATIARIAAEERVDALACGDPDDVRRIRDEGVALPILLYASTQAEALPAIAALDVIVTAHDEATLAVCLAHDLAFSLKLDSGFHRFGFRAHELAPVLAAAARHPAARVHSVYTHLTDAESPPAVAAQVEQIGVAEGLLHLFISGSTAALSTIEFESGVVNDFRAAIDRLFPREISYEHDRRWGDGNGYSHVRAAFLKPTLSIPIAGGRLLLGTWQQIVLLDFDNRPRQRHIQGQVMGLKSGNG